MEPKLFDPEAIRVAADGNRQRAFQNARAKIQQRLQAVIQCRNSGLLYLFSGPDQIELENDIDVYADRVQDWFQKANTHQSRDTEGIVSVLAEGEALIPEGRELLSRIAPHHVSAEIVATRAAAALNSRVEEYLVPPVDCIKNVAAQVEEQIGNALAEMAQMKVQLGISETFKSSIEKKVFWAKALSAVMGLFYVASLVGVAALLSGELGTDMSLTGIHLVLFRMGMAIPLLLVARFFIVEYRRQASMVAHSEHLQRLMGGGAFYIAKLLESDESAKKAASEAMAALFIHAYQADILAHDARNSKREPGPHGEPFDTVARAVQDATSRLGAR